MPGDTLGLVLLSSFLPFSVQYNLTLTAKRTAGSLSLKWTRKTLDSRRDDERAKV